MDPTTQLSNQAFLDYVTSDDPGLMKQANDNVTNYTRRFMREEGFTRKILPPLAVSDDQLTRQVDTAKPTIVIDREPGVPAAMSIPFGTTPMGRYIKGNRYRVMFDRIVSRKFNSDIAELRTYQMDIRQVISDNAIKDILAEEDAKFIAASDAIIGSAGSTVSATGAIQHVNQAGTVTRTNVVESLKIMNNTPSRLEVDCALLNHKTVKDVLKWQRTEAGGDISQEMLIKGFTEPGLFGVKWVVTIKRNLVADSSIYYYAEPSYLGKFLTLEDATMFTDKRAYTIEFFIYESIGGAIANVAGVTKVNFTG